MRHYASLLIASALAVGGCGDSTAPASPCDRGTLPTGGVVTGTLDGHACSSGGEFQQPYADYRVVLTAGERYLFTLQSDSRWLPRLELVTDTDASHAPMIGMRDAAGHSELLFVSPVSSTATLRVTSGLGVPGPYTLQSGQCGGSSTKFPLGQSASAQGAIDATDCVIHGLFFDSDSAHVDTYVLSVGRNDSELVTVTALDPSVGSYVPALVITGPFAPGAPSMWEYQVATGDSLSTQFSGEFGEGDYIIAVGSRTSSDFGNYRLTVSPAAP